MCSSEPRARPEAWLADLVASAPGFAYGPFRGRVFVYMNRPGLTFAPEASFPIYDGDQAGAGWGEALAAIEVDGESGDELFVAAPRQDSGEAQEGTVTLFRGWTQELTVAPTPYSPLPIPGAPPFTVGDFDSDGFSDFLDATGALRYGSLAGLGSTPDGVLSQPSDSCYDLYPGVLSSGDVDADGFGDAFADFYANFGCHGGYAAYPQQHWIYAGSSAGLDLNPYQTIDGDCCYNAGQFIGDVNGDGYEDALVEALSMGRVYVYLGSDSGFEADPVQFYPAGNLQDGGRYLAVLPGNLNGDPYGDLVLVDHGPRVSVYHGSPSRLVFQESLDLSNEPGQYTFALTLQDLDGDGYDDLLLEKESQIVGKCVTYLGSPSGFVRSPQWWEPALSPANQSPFWNKRVLAVADMDDDGYVDLLLEGGRLHRGSPAGISRVPAWFGSLNFPPQRIGPAADFDGDGRKELVSYSYPQWSIFEVGP